MIRIHRTGSFLHPFFLFCVLILSSPLHAQISADSAITLAGKLLYSDPYKAKEVADSILRSDASGALPPGTKARCESAIAKANYLIGDYPSSLEHALIFLKISRELNDQQRLESDALNVLGVIYQAQRDYDKAISYYTASLEIRKKMKDNKMVAASLSNIGMVYQEKDDKKNAISRLLEARNILQAMNNKYELGNTLNTLGNIYWESKQLDSAYNTMNEAIRIRIAIGDSVSLAISCINMAGILNSMNRKPEAEAYFRKSIAMSVKSGDRNSLCNAYENFSGFFEHSSRPDSALHYFHLFKALDDSLFSTERSSKIADMQMKFEYEQKEKLRLLEQKARDAEQQVKVERLQFLIASSSAILLVVLVFSFFLYRGYVNKKKAHKEISDKNVIIELKNKEIIDSINYAQHLQEAILPPQKLISSYLGDFFIFYQPKDIVAGDFYWIENSNELILLAAADCTGHGVPGAMVSVVCSNALNRAVKEFHLSEPGKILDKVRELIIETFEKSESRVNDGMDISLCGIDRKNMRLTWAGANNPLWLIRDGQLTDLRPDKQSVSLSDNSTPFTTHTLELRKGDMIYLFSDGYADQFGGPNGKKFKSAKMKELFLSNYSRTMSAQRDAIERAFRFWKEDREQIDDVCVIGFRV